MSALDEIQRVRLQKLELLKKTFGDVFPARPLHTHRIPEAVEKFFQLLKSKKKFAVAGRIRALRPHGGSIFFDLEGDGALFQGFMRLEDIAEDRFKLFHDAIDIGDIIEVSGKAYRTKRKEKSILVSDWRPLAKALRPLPEKWHGLQDIEERYRKRALDLLANEKTPDIFRTRARIISFLRAYLDKQGFVEVETPILQPIPGGATARPFQTHHNALDTELYLRIAPELYLKKLIVGGFEKVYEIGRSFRNEGIDVTHNPEFTTIEAYETYQDYEYVMKFHEIFFEKLANALFKKKVFSYGSKSFEIKKPFKRISFFDALKQHALLSDIENMKKEGLVIAAKRLGITPGEPLEAGSIMEDIFKKAVKPHLIQPTIIYDWPASLLPLAKRSSKNLKLTESFQIYIGGLELVKAFSELNDPIDQRERFLEQEEQRKKGNEEASPIDYDFIENLEYGMPPTAGWSIGVDRLTMLLTDMHNIRDVILFPTLRPR